MESINEVNIAESDFITAEELKNLTASQEDLFEKKVMDLKTNFMSTIVKLATEQGFLSYRATFRKEADTSVLNKITEDFQELGYKVELDDGVQKMPNKDGSISEIEITDFVLSWDV